jgi:EAL domain-containing protein (putative c-di-GMP-specific phosphodiesterase class I)
MHKALAGLLRMGDGAQSLPPNELDLFVSWSEVDRASADVERAIAEMAFTPIVHEGRSIHLALGASITPFADFESPMREGAATTGEVKGSWRSVEGYRRDMEIAAEAMSALTQARFHLIWQPVKAADPSRGILYYEALARFTDTNAKTQTPGEVLGALERSGLIRAFDRYVVLMVLRELEADPDVILGVNISFQSAIEDVWWTSILHFLEQHEDIAKRLIVEITHPAKMPTTARSFVAKLQRLNCRVAFDDFAVGYLATRQLLAIAPDIIKIDVLFLQYAEQSAHMMVMFEDLVAMAGATIRAVIAKGIETEAQSLFAKSFQQRFPFAAGDCWQQGLLYGRPSSRRTELGSLETAGADWRAYSSQEWVAAASASG